MAAEDEPDGSAERGPAPGRSETDGAASATTDDHDTDDGGAGRSGRPFPQPGGKGFADAALLAGRPFSSYLHVGALLAAAGADVGAFYEIVARAQSVTSGLLIYLVVIGFTATVVYLGHVVGVVFRNATACAQATSTVAAWTCIAVLVGLGAVAFLVRLFGPATVAPAEPTFRVGAPVSAAPADNAQLISAALFLALYVATVLVAAVGAYLTHNPLRESYSVAVAAYRKLSAKTASARAAFLLAQSRVTSEETNREAAERTLEMQRQSLLALAEELKHKAHIRLAAAAQDPAVTDAYSRDDERPYTHPPRGPRANGSA